MVMKLRRSLVALMLAGSCAHVALSGQSSGSSPITVTADPLPLQQNADGTLIAHVAALTNLRRLEISIAASTGVELVNDVPPVALSDVAADERHDIPVPVRLTAPDFGYVVLSTRVTTPSGTRVYKRSVVVGTMPPAPAREAVGVTEDLADLTLIRVAGGNAIVRFGDKELVIVRAGDRLGRNGAETREVAAGRIVLDETFIGADGRPNRARVTINEGEKGGTRVLFRNEEEPPAAGRQRVVVAPRRNPRQ
jgi:hypothetical protein